MRKLLHASIATAISVAVFSLTACHGNATPGQGYVPAPVAQPAVPQGAVRSQASPINASCKTPITVGQAKDKSCHFTEVGYKGEISIDDHLGGVAVVRPHQGTKETPFIVRGLTPGDGYFTVKDAMGHALRVGVTVPQAAIVSTCGRKIDIQIAGIVTCQFHEPGYDGQFTIDSHLQGIASVSPMTGNKTTQFTVLGLLEGGGYFIVHGARNLRVHVEVTTL